MKARVKLIEGVSFVGQSESGHSVVMDGAARIRRQESRRAPDGNAAARARRLFLV